MLLRKPSDMMREVHPSVYYHPPLPYKISFIIDDNPRKKNKFMPIANIPIVSFKKAYKNMSNSVLIILGWAQTERIIKFLKSLGLKLNIITIYPKFKIIKLK